MKKYAFAFSLLLLTSFTQAHVVLLDPAAAADSSYRAALRVGHGCGTEATTTLRVLIPEGFNAAQPMPKPGWTLRTQTGPLWFKVLQQCANGSLDWSKIPASGTSTHGMASPAALLEVLDIQSGAGHSH